jgi:hypothetical protein
VRIRLLAATAAAGLGLLAAGCGGDDGEGGGGQTFDAQSYAAETCEVALLWSGAQEQLMGLERGNVEATDAEQAVVDAQAKTTVYIGTIRGIEEPEGADEQAAHASLLETADSLSEHSQAIKAEGQPLATGETTPEEAAAAVLPQVDGIFADLRESVKQLDAIATDVDLTAVVRDDQSCRALGL